MTKTLLDRLAAATEGSRELDGAIAAAIAAQMGKAGVYWPDDGEPHWSEWRGQETVMGELVLHYTTSLDAALTLVPEGWRYIIDESAPDVGISVSLRSLEANFRQSGIRETAATPALAICIAALNAMGEG